VRPPTRARAGDDVGDAIAGDVAAWAGTIVTTYVGGRSLEKIARTIWSRP